MIAGSPSPSQYPAKMTTRTPSWRYMFSENSWSALGPCFLNILSRWNLVASDLIEWFLTVTIRTYRTDFYLFTWCTDTGVIVTHTLSSTGLWPHYSCWLMRSSLLWLRAAPYCTLLRTVTYCSCDAYCSHYSIVLLQYISQACWVLCSPRLDFFHRTAIVLW